MIKKPLTLSFVLLSFFVSAQSIVTDRPDQTESSTTVPKGSIQIETGILVGFSEDDTFSERQILIPSTLFRIALVRGIELRVLSQFESVKNELTDKTVSGISDLEIGSKIQLLKKENTFTEIAFLSHLIVPTGSKNLTLDKFGTINKLSISHPLKENIGLGYNIGYNYFGEGKGDFTYSLALGFGITKKLSVYIEPYGDVVEFKNHVSSIDAGVTYLIRNNFQVDFSFGTGINHTMNYMSLGCSINVLKMAKEE